MECCSVEMDSSSCCGDSGSSGKFRKFLTNAEKIEMLKEYQETLENEAKGVSEKISRLQKD